uniref:hypothetical protein n=1 Tax=Methylobacterium sp. B34 TaxID=95563 RepID=UPI000FE143DA|nr:hypothetical protein [Methylobacterium sp. B34]
MFEIRSEPELLAQIQGLYVGVAKVESWPLVDPRNMYDGARNYRYTDTSGNSYPVFVTPATAKFPFQAICNQIDTNMSKLAGKGVFIARRKS